MRGGSLATLPVRFIRKRVHSASVDPAIVEIEQRTYRDGKIDRIVFPSGLVEQLHIISRNLRRIVIHFIDKTK